MDIFFDFRLMIFNSRWSVAILISGLFLLLGAETFSAIPPNADIPQPCLDKAWLGKHHYLASLALRASRKPPLDLYFLGDSITEFWPQIAPQSWRAEFKTLHVLNCGVSGDTTQNILYRITHGEFDRLSPKVVVVLAGINNLSLSPQLEPQELAHGLQRIVTILQTKSPSSKILLLSIFPAGAPNDPLRSRIMETNQLLSKLADNTSLFYLDIYHVFLSPKGDFPARLSPDGTHLNAEGYQAWADAMRPKLRELLQDANK